MFREEVIPKSSCLGPSRSTSLPLMRGFPGLVPGMQSSSSLSASDLRRDSGEPTALALDHDVYEFLHL
jgi:hypothetical protein